jgi:hypothetical protein
MPEPMCKEALFALPPEALERELVRLDCILDELTALRNEAERRLEKQRRPKLRLVVAATSASRSIDA